MSREGNDGAVSANDRSLRLRSACDPGTPVNLLLELAMEFPDQVAANPVLALALASQPDCISSATDVALACIMSSPALPDAVGGAFESLIRDRAAAAPDSPAASAAEYVRFWRAAGARRLLVDVSVPVAAPEGLHAGFERACRGRAILAARLGVDSFVSFGNEKNGEESEFEACGGSWTSGKIWPRVLLPAPPGGDFVFSRRCAWNRARGEAVVELAEYPGNASALILLPADGDVTASVHFDHLKLNDRWAHPLTDDGLEAIRSVARALGRLSGGLREGELAAVCCVLSDGVYQDCKLGVIDRDFLESYFAEGEDVLSDDPLDDPDDEDLGDEAPSEPSPRSDLIELLKRVDPTEFGFALDGCKSCGGYDDFVAALRSGSFDAGPASPWMQRSLASLFLAAFPPGRLEWSGERLQSRRGSMDDLPLFFVALADAAGNAAVAMLHFLYADGWQEWRMSTDPLLPVSASR